MMITARSGLAGLVLSTSLGALAACSGGGASGGTSGGAASGTLEQSFPGVDACSLLTPDMAKNILGAGAVDQQPDTENRGCSYDATDLPTVNYQAPSVSLTVVGSGNFATNSEHIEGKQDVDGIGDEAFTDGLGELWVRQGDNAFSVSMVSGDDAADAADLKRLAEQILAKR